MNIQKVAYILFCLWGTIAYAQDNAPVDTLVSSPWQAHQYFYLKVPVGELYMRPSQRCGMSTTRVNAPDAVARFSVSEKSDDDNNLHRYVELKAPNPTAQSTPSEGSNLRMAGNLNSLDAYGAAQSFRSEVNLDPNLSTDLNLDLGVGAARLDLSNLSLRTVNVKSAFSDVMITYQQPNQVEMKKMHIHVTKGDVVLKQPELARAHHIVVKNDMGNTKIWLSDRHLPHSTISVHAGVGDCLLVVDRNHPTRIVIKGGIFSKQDVAPTFRNLSRGVYANQAFSDHCQTGERGCQHSTTVICNLDLGSVSVMEKQ